MKSVNRQADKLARVNLAQAPNIKGQHGPIPQAELLRRLRTALVGQSDKAVKREAVTDVLLEWAEISAARK